MCRYITVLFVLILALAECWAVEPYEPVRPNPLHEPYRVTRFPELTGLGLVCMAEDSTGNMWFGVGDGVRVYDGTAWTAYSKADGLLGASVTALCTTRDGIVYAGTGLGISRFENGTWTRVFPREGDLIWPVYDLLPAADGSLWAGTWWGAVRLDERGIRVYTTDDQAAALKLLMPDITVSIVPEEAVPQVAWPDGAGIGFVPARSTGKWYRDVVSVIALLAPGGPGQGA